MTARIGVPVVIENRPGAATNLAAEAAANAAPDGYTVFTAGNETLVFNPALYRRLPFDPDNALRPLGLIARFHLVLCAKPQGVVASAAGFVEHARARAGAMDYGSPGIGSPHHLAMERLARELGVKLNHVPYRGMAPVMNDLVAGTVETAVLDMAAGAEVIRSGRVRPLVLLSPASPAIPDVPTAAEAYGLPGFAAYAWQGADRARAHAGRRQRPARRRARGRARGASRAGADARDRPRPAHRRAGGATPPDRVRAGDLLAADPRTRDRARLTLVRGLRAAGRAPKLAARRMRHDARRRDRHDRRQRLARRRPRRHGRLVAPPRHGGG